MWPSLAPCTASGPPADRLKRLRAAARRRQIPADAAADSTWWLGWGNGCAAEGTTTRARTHEPLDEEEEELLDPRAALTAADGGFAGMTDDATVAARVAELWPDGRAAASPLAVGVVQALLDAGITLSGRLVAHLRTVLPPPVTTEGELAGDDGAQALQIVNAVRRILVDTEWGLPKLSSEGWKGRKGVHENRSRKQTVNLHGRRPGAAAACAGPPAARPPAAHRPGRCPGHRPHPHARSRVAVCCDGRPQRRASRRPQCAAPHAPR